MFEKFLSFFRAHRTNDLAKKFEVWFFPFFGATNLIATNFVKIRDEERERERERERDWNSENPAFYSKSRPPYVPRVLYHLKIARVLELMERGEGLVELLPILPGSNVWICYYSLILPLFELLPILPGWTANVPKSLRKVRIWTIFKTLSGCVEKTSHHWVKSIIFKKLRTIG